MMLKKMVIATTKTQIGWMKALPLMKRFISIMIFTLSGVAGQQTLALIGKVQPYREDDDDPGH